MIKLESDAFRPNEAIPREYSGEGKDVSPLLRWTNVPEGTRQLALVVDDPDAHGEPWVHWLIYNIPGQVNALSAGLPTTTTLPKPAGAAQGLNSWGRIGYGGPMPPRGDGLHHYQFTLYALDTAPGLKPGLDRGQLLKAIDGHVLGQGELIGTYQR